MWKQKQQHSSQITEVEKKAARIIKTIAADRKEFWISILFLSPQLLEAVEAVHEAVAASPSEEPPLPPYPDISDLSISGKNSA